MHRAYGSPLSLGCTCEWTKVHPYNMHRTYGSGSAHAGKVCSVGGY